MAERIFNFSAGPAVLPLEVIETAKENLLSFGNSGIGIMELSHRSAEFEGVLNAAIENLRELLNISADYAVIFTTGGASNQFSMVPLNLRAAGQTADYIVSGSWAEKAFAEAKRFGETHAAASSKDRNFCYIPTELKLSHNPAYLHFTSNNTIFGTQFSQEPNVGSTLLVCDASSDMLCRKIDVAKYGLIYAGAQKNLGPAGVTLVVLRKDLLARTPGNLPIMLDYNTYAKHNSLYNTPPTFPIYVAGEVFKWIKAQGGLSAIEKRNREKAGILYQAIDSTPFYQGTADKDSRSLMNVTFRLANHDLEPVFAKEALAAGFSGLEGHRSVGGMRASIYNAFPKAGIEALVAFMREFERKHG